jgi:hypothetical protein
VGANHKQVGMRCPELCQDFLVNVSRRLNAELDRNGRRRGGGQAPQVAQEPLTISVLEHQGRQIHRGEVCEHIE